MAVAAGLVERGKMRNFAGESLKCGLSGVGLTESVRRRLNEINTECLLPRKKQEQ